LLEKVEIKVPRGHVAPPKIQYSLRLPRRIPTDTIRCGASVALELT
jgi:hypothetical protein